MTSHPVRATAPVRLDFAGGWTDVPPFATIEGGVVVNAAIALRVEAEFTSGGEALLATAEDLGQWAEIGDPGAPHAADGLLLHRAALRMFPPGSGHLRTRSDVPPGSGLGSSGALDVALVAVLARVRGESPSPAEIAALGRRLEVQEAGLAGGGQDQSAAALGGWHRLAFSGDAVGARRLTLAPGFEDALARRTVICYTGRSRVSGDTITRVMGAYQRGDSVVVGALREMRDIAERMVEALEAGSLARVGQLLTANWACQQRLDCGMCTGEMAALEATMRAAGAIGAKAAGAGAGGSMFFIMGDDREAGVRAAEIVGARVLAAGWSPTGVESC